MRPAWFATLAILAVVAGAAGRYVSLRRDLVSQRQAVAAAWSQVEIALERRADLVPTLAGSIEKAAGSDSAPVFQDLANARAALAAGGAPQQMIASNEKLSNALSRLLLLSEGYRQLQSNRHFQQQQFEIGEAENRIAVERRKYNETLEHYNSSIELFPNNIVARISGFTRNDAYFPTGPGVQPDAAERSAHPEAAHE